MIQTQEILTMALQLPPEERVSLVRHLLLSLEKEEQQPDADSEAAWRAELIARMERFDRGETVASDWREALARIRQNLKQDQ